PDRPVLVDRFLEDAIEIDVDVISDGDTSVLGAIMEHIEPAGVHSGDSACVIPPFSLSESMKAEIMAAAKNLAKELEVRGLMNIQFAVKDEDLYVIEVNPRASRTVPFVSKAIGVPLAKLAAKVMAGEKLVDLGFTEEVYPTHISVKEAVFPFARFPGIDILLSPEMKSTGEVMGIDKEFGMAYAKSQMAAGESLPASGNIFLSVKDADKQKSVQIAKDFHDLGFTIYSSTGTAKILNEQGVPAKTLFKLAEGRRPNVLDMIKNGEVSLIINTPSGQAPREDEVKIRSTAVANRIPVLTNLRAAEASIQAIRSLQKNEMGVQTLQEYHGLA
ncbi:MAG: carbamoyl-phosphate synthase large subunit, partial [Verrucomicrobiales bacterium]